VLTLFAIITFIAVIGAFAIGMWPSPIARRLAIVVWGLAPILLCGALGSDDWAASGLISLLWAFVVLVGYSWSRERSKSRPYRPCARLLA
jgi:hypothetical protein